MNLFKNHFSQKSILGNSIWVLSTQSLVVLFLLLGLLPSQLNAQKRKSSGHRHYKKKHKTTHPITHIKNVGLENWQSTEFQNFCNKVKVIKNEGVGQAQILILGDSHMQCEDFESGLKRYFTDSLGLPYAGKGFVFPYPLARTSHRSENRFWPTANWAGCRFTKESNSCEWGLAGWTAQLTSDSASFFWSNGAQGFKKGDGVLIFSPQRCSSEFKLSIADSLGNEEIMAYDSTKAGFFAYLNSDSKHISFKIQRLLGDAEFVVSGISFQPVSFGLVWGVSGTNGARLDHYLSNPNFPQHLRTLNPDMVIISLGTNEAFSPDFNPENVRNILLQLLSKIKSASPETAILIIGPPDHQYGNKSNPRIKLINTIYSEVAQELDFVFWNQQEAMGGSGSIFTWKNKRLATRDLVHFTTDGYHLQAKLLGAAFKPHLIP